jgi:alkylation response protein AidB-like acyl-CoA dehydrogenase
VLQVVTGGARAGAALVAHPGVDKVSFTGSSSVGRLVLRSAADSIKRVSVELGGKSPNIVFDDADLPAADAAHVAPPAGTHGRRPEDVARQGLYRQAVGQRGGGRVVDRCLQIFGGRGYDRSYPIERMYREVRVDRIWEGTSEIQRVIVANELIKRGTAFLDLPIA